MKEYGHYDAMGLAELVAKKDVSPAELLKAALKRAEAAKEAVNCFSTVFPEVAEEQLSEGLPDGPFKGVPFVTKDLGVEIKGQPLTGGSRAFRDNIAQRDSVLTERYRAAGLTLFGQTTSPEWGLTTSTESSLFGQTRNPWNPERTSGGSSGGASAAVSCGVLPLAQASDGGGSIRIPAACTGLFGLKPSRGRVPMGPGKTENWNGLSTVHAVSRSVRDNAALLDATHGPERGMRYGSPPAPEESFLACTLKDPEPLKIALWTEAPNGTKPHKEALEGMIATTKLLASLGHIVEEARPDFDGEALAKGMTMIVSAHSAHTVNEREKELGRKLCDDELEPMTHALVGLGRKVPMTELVAADYAFIDAAIKFETFLDDNEYDLILAPTITMPPVELGRLSLDPTDPDEYGELVGAFSANCPVFNQMGAPAMSVPLHWTKDALPLGMMFGARFGREDLLYALAGQLERAQPWFDRRPPIWFGDL